MENDFRFFIISLKRSKDRLDAVMEKTKLPYTVFYGIDGKEYSRDFLQRFTNNKGSFYSNQVISCALSHILLWKHILDSYSKDNNLIYYLSEDDIYLDQKQLEKNKELIKELATKDNIVFVYQNSLFLDTNKKKDFYKLRKINSTGGYFISYDILEKLYNYYLENKVNGHIDASLQKTVKHLDITPLYINLGRKTDSETTMSDKKEKFLLNLIRSDDEFYYNIKLPFFALSFMVINIYSLFVVFLLTTAFISNILQRFYGNDISNVLLIILYILIGMLLWDGLEFF